MSSPLVFSAFAVRCALGNSAGEVTRALREGRTGIAPRQRFATEGYAPTCLAPLRLEGWAEALCAQPEPTDPDPSIALLLEVAAEALRAAKLEAGGAAPARLGLVLGASTGGLFGRSAYELSERPERERARYWRLAQFERQVSEGARALGVLGPRLFVSTACTSSANALAHAASLLREGHAEAVLVGGFDVLQEETFAGFHAMGALAPGPCAPFSTRFGLTLGEAVLFTVLEPLEAARGRGLEPSVSLLGAGLSLDGYHATAPHPAGYGVERAVRASLRDAGLGPEAVGYVNVHGTGTEANDATEWAALERVLGPRAAEVPTSASKSFFGHTLGAAGLLEAFVCVQGLEGQWVAPTLGLDAPREGAPADPVAEDRARAHAHSIALSTNAAFGGSNSALVLGLAERAPPARAPSSRELWIQGVGVLLPEGRDLAEVLHDAAAPRGSGRLAPRDALKLLRGVDPRTADLAALYLTAASQLALRDAGLRLQGAARERTAFLALANELSEDTAEDFWKSLRSRGFARASAPAFARVVANAAQGFASRTLGLLGPGSVLVGGAGASFQALALARGLLEDESVDRVLLAAEGHRGPHSRRCEALLAEQDQGAATEAPRPSPHDAAVGLLLAREPADARSVQVLALALSGPSSLGDALEQVFRAAPLGKEDLLEVHLSTGDDALEREPLRGCLGPALGGLAVFTPYERFGRSGVLDSLALARAAGALRRRPSGEDTDTRASNAGGARRSVLVAGASELLGSAAVLLSVPESASR